MFTRINSYFIAEVLMPVFAEGLLCIYWRCSHGRKFLERSGEFLESRVFDLHAKLNLIRQLRYFKAHAYRVKPLVKKGIVAVDGEHFPFEEFQVEVHPRLATLLSPHSRYAADFPSTLPSGRRPRGNDERE
jgi:hypothetical protein